MEKPGVHDPKMMDTHPSQAMYDIEARTHTHKSWIHRLKSWTHTNYGPIHPKAWTHTNHRHTQIMDINPPSHRHTNHGCIHSSHGNTHKTYHGQHPKLPPPTNTMGNKQTHCTKCRRNSYCTCELIDLSFATCLLDGSGQHQISLGQKRGYPALRTHPRRPALFRS